MHSKPQASYQASVCWTKVCNDAHLRIFKLCESRQAPLRCSRGTHAGIAAVGKLQMRLYAAATAQHPAGSGIQFCTVR